MAVEAIKAQLMKALSEKKMPMGPGPDGKKGTDDDKPAFLDQKKGDKKSKTLFNNACRLLGLFNVNKNKWEEFKKLNTDISKEFIAIKINERDQAKKNGNFNLADKIREELLNKGIIIEDLKGKTVWKFK